MKKPAKRGVLISLADADWGDWGIRLLTVFLVVGSIAIVIAVGNALYPPTPNFIMDQFTVTDQRACVSNISFGGFISAVFHLQNTGAPGHARVIVRVNGAAAWQANYSLGRGGSLSAQAKVYGVDCLPHEVTGKVDAQW